MNGNSLSKEAIGKRITANTTTANNFREHVTWGYRFAFLAAGGIFIPWFLSIRNINVIVLRHPRNYSHYCSTRTTHNCHATYARCGRRLRRHRTQGSLSYVLIILYCVKLLSSCQTGNGSRWSSNSCCPSPMFGAGPGTCRASSLAISPPSEKEKAPSPSSSSASTIIRSLTRFSIRSKLSMCFHCTGGLTYLNSSFLSTIVLQKRKIPQLHEDCNYSFAGFPGRSSQWDSTPGTLPWNPMPHAGDIDLPTPITVTSPVKLGPVASKMPFKKKQRDTWTEKQRALADKALKVGSVTELQEKVSLICNSY